MVSFTPSRSFYISNENLEYIEDLSKKSGKSKSSILADCIDSHRGVHFALGIHLASIEEVNRLLGEHVKKFHLREDVLDSNTTHDG